jgi:hypothetical protein
MTRNMGSIATSQMLAQSDGAIRSLPSSCIRKERQRDREWMAVRQRITVPSPLIAWLTCTSRSEIL